MGQTANRLCIAKLFWSRASCVGVIVLLSFVPVVAQAQIPNNKKPDEPFDLVAAYPDRFDLLRVVDDGGRSSVASSPTEWKTRRRHIQLALQKVMGPLPDLAKRVPLDVSVLEEKRLDGGLVRWKVSYQSDVNDRVAAYLFVPATMTQKKSPAILCLQQTTIAGKAEPAGLAGDASLHYALHLAQRGYVTLAPDYPGFGDSKYNFSPSHGYVSGSMKAIWDNIRSIDFLETRNEVDASKIGVIGHSLGGHNAMFTAVFEPRIQVIVSSCGFTTFRKDDVPSWNGFRYMPRIKTEFGNDASRLPFDFPEIVAAFAPRPFLACAAKKDRDFDYTGVEEVLQAASKVYQLHNAADKLRGYYPDAPHSFPAEARQAAYEWLDSALR